MEPIRRGLLHRAWRLLLLQRDEEGPEEKSRVLAMDSAAGDPRFKLQLQSSATEAAIWSSRDLEKNNLINLSIPLQVSGQKKSSNGSAAGSCKKPPRPPRPASAGVTKSANRLQKKSGEKLTSSSRKGNSNNSNGSSIDLGTILSLVFTLIVAALILFQGFSSPRNPPNSQTMELKSSIHDPAPKNGSPDQNGAVMNIAAGIVTATEPQGLTNLAAHSN